MFESSKPQLNDFKVEPTYLPVKMTVESLTDAATIVSMLLDRADIFFKSYEVAKTQGKAGDAKEIYEVLFVLLEHTKEFNSLLSAPKNSAIFHRREHLEFLFKQLRSII